MSLSAPSTARLPFPLGFTSAAAGAAAAFFEGKSTQRSDATDTVFASRQAEPFPIIAFCHLSWDWVWQRPQQFLSRLARRHPLLFVETHCVDTPAGEVVFRDAEGHPNITIARVHLPAARWHDGAFIDAERRRLLLAAIAVNAPLAERFEQPVLWFNDPMAVTAYAGQFGERAVVYDCMDELSQFKNPPAGLLERERELLRLANVVFCGGRKMRDKRLPLNSNCHFYGTGVDVAHFGAARGAALALDPAIAETAALGQPILGYFGVVDERLDYELIAKLADARRNWQVVIVGPACKVDPAEFPKRANLHWLGAQPYARLPGITKAFSVALMPFALNAATEFINPTKALEYMAAGRPVVSTALDEVRSNFGQVARVARSHEEFINYCVREAAAPSERRLARGLALASANTWDAIADRMEGHVLDVLAAAETESAVAAAETDADTDTVLASGSGADRAASRSADAIPSVFGSIRPLRSALAAAQATLPAATTTPSTAAYV